MASGKGDFPLEDVDSRVEDEEEEKGEVGGAVPADNNNALHCRGGATDTFQALGGSESVDGVTDHQQMSPIHFKEKTTNICGMCMVIKQQSFHI